MPAPLGRCCGGGGGGKEPGGPSRAGPPPSSLWSGHERLRIGERLQASLAGLWELELLREAQRGTVERALRDPQPEGRGQNGLPPSAKLDRSQSEDLLGTPKKPCCSARSSEDDPRVLPGRPGEGPEKGCLGLQMAGEPLLLPKRAGVSGGDTQETLEADSRPSSGFYETSEVGSLSDSCASVHSEGGPGGSRCSLGSLSQLPGLRESSGVRPRSADEAAVRLLDLQLALGDAPGPDSRRPVSTGDLELLLGLGDFSLPPRKSPSLQLPQYQSDLVSRTTHETYPYPSPLHAVALQSPLFTSSFSGSSSQEDLGEGSPEAPQGADPPPRGPLCPPEQRRARLDRYIAQLVLRHKCRSSAPSRTEAGGLLGPSGSSSSSQKSRSLSSVCSAGLAPAPGGRIRRRISTCSHLRSPEGSEGARDPPPRLGSQGDLTPFLEIRSAAAGACSLSRASEPSVMSLPGPPLPCREPPLAPSPHRLEGGAARARLLHGVQAEAPGRREGPWPRGGPAGGWGQLYKGKHASRDLVKAAEGQEKPAERSWLSPRELLRRLSLRRRPSARMGSRARASSEASLPVASHSGPPAGKGKAGRPRWASVLEISSKGPGRQRLRGGPFPPPRAPAFSAHSPDSFRGGSPLDRPPQPWARLGEADASSTVSLNGDWIIRHLGERWPPAASATLDSADLPVGSFKLRRSRSFKELKRMMTRSLRGARTPK
ncbi:dapper homolog 2-like [Hemicordylus capensis]|uniref:dapper homolog 2-like n=1 Tax=Hemicordylus capensis TaxID=884348 RepID=UPI00230413A4|nr:dapper homolog 2-like [Hemicordylus capensis]